MRGRPRTMSERRALHGECNIRTSVLRKACSLQEMSTYRVERAQRDAYEHESAHCASESSTHEQV